ncbi:hypothetical protein GP486_008250 [Trichoglossum hirsutum]|uniref:BHLH domain-containing protein n=1 Tax=Trichoglossum hirsutum TaxID=265104 RepID=A0A9P8IAC3_9PEZI|nr:hypothetical protein GP486_008250 [Trichoglossum hirsutum]
MDLADDRDHGGRGTVLSKLDWDGFIDWGGFGEGMPGVEAEPKRASLFELGGGGSSAAPSAVPSATTTTTTTATRARQTGRGVCTQRSQGLKDQPPPSSIGSDRKHEGLSLCSDSSAGPRGESSSSSSSSSRIAKQKSTHNATEKRYRRNLNDKIASLRDSVPALRAMAQDRGGRSGGPDGSTMAPPTPRKLGKATVLSKAAEYIHQLEDSNRWLAYQCEAKRARIEAFKELDASGKLMGAGTANHHHHRDPLSGVINPVD